MTHGTSRTTIARAPLSSDSVEKVLVLSSSDFFFSSEPSDFMSLAVLNPRPQGNAPACVSMELVLSSVLCLVKRGLVGPVAGSIHTLKLEPWKVQLDVDGVDQESEFAGMVFSQADGSMVPLISVVPLMLESHFVLRTETTLVEVASATAFEHTSLPDHFHANSNHIYSNHICCSALVLDFVLRQLFGTSPWLFSGASGLSPKTLSSFQEKDSFQMRSHMETIMTKVVVCHSNAR